MEGRAKHEPELAFFSIAGDNVAFIGLDPDPWADGSAQPLFDIIQAKAAAKYLTTDEVTLLFDDERGTFVMTDWEDRKRYVFGASAYNGTRLFNFGPAGDWRRIPAEI